MNREALIFDPEKQNTQYNAKPLPTKIPVIEINKKASETAEYYWLARYESIPSNTPFNKFLNKFKAGEFARGQKWPSFKELDIDFYESGPMQD